MSSEPRYALVTGGSGDIGGAIVGTLAAAGWTPVILDTLPEEDGLRRARELVGGGDVHYLSGSSASAEAVSAALDLVPRIDLAVLCAGVVRAQPFLEIAEEEWRRHLEVNLTGAFIAAQSAARRMVDAATRGHLLFVSSWVAERPWPEIAAYSSSKAAMNQLMRQAALELSPYGIRANAVAPGIVMAGLAKTQYENEPQYAARAARAIPLGAPQTAQQVADAVGFLASPGAASVTGSVLTVDAGCSLGTMQ